MATEQAKPFFNRRIFWDVDVDKLNFEKRSAFIIERVFERGDVEDIRNCRRYYGDERIADVLLASKYIPDHRLYLASAIINKPVNLFRCYILKQSIPGLSPY